MVHVYIKCKFNIKGGEQMKDKAFFEMSYRTWWHYDQAIKQGDIVKAVKYLSIYTNLQRGF